MAQRFSIRITFPSPWQVKETPSGYCVEASNGRRIAHLYGEDETVRRDILKQPTMAEALAIAKAIARLPELI